jgi:NAD(P)H-quinone oxidoreductase subunit 5
MLDQQLLIQILGLTAVGAPIALVVVLGLTSVVGHPMSEQPIGRAVQTATLTGLVASIAMLILMLALDTRSVPVDLKNWVGIDDFHFHVKFVFDRLSVPFVVLSFLLCGTIGAFANKYMHRERGFNRFFLFYALFLMGMVVTSLAGTIETLFFGWELVGLSSALLVAFYHERPSPVRNGLRVWTVYRISDAALLLASVALHHLSGEGDFGLLLGTGVWPEGQATITQQQAFLIGLLLLLAAAGKSALVPFSGWLPRAMEGPTPSSAVFYGALSVHLGAFLLLRVSPILDLSFWLSALVVLLGTVTAVFGAFAGRVQTDIKCALSFASVTQVGIIVAEIGTAGICVGVFGWTQIGVAFRYLALVHILSHACLRTLQFLRAPSLLFDYRMMENAIGTSLPRVPGPWERLTSHAWLYRLALERGYLDSALADYIVSPFLRMFRWFDALERRWTDFLAGGQSRESEPVPHVHGVIEEVI